MLTGSGMFTLSQLQDLGAVAGTVPLAPANQVGMGWLRAFDFKLSWIGKIPMQATTLPDSAQHWILQHV